MSFIVGMGVGESADVKSACAEAVRAARDGLSGATPRAAFITATVDHDASQVFQAFQSELGGVPLHGVTTSLGVLGPTGVHNRGHGAVAVMLFGGDAGVARVASSTDKDGLAAGRAAAKALLEQSGGVAPTMILFNASPGDEEAMLKGIAEVFPSVPCQGGSAADHTIEGRWSVFTANGPVAAGLSLLGLYGDVRVGTALRTPYGPSGATARATAVEGRRLDRLGDEPAAQVLNRWLQGAIESQVRSGGNILAQTALQPIAVRRGSHFVTVHPAQVHAASGAVDVFARIEPGDEVCLMSATPDMLVREVAQLVDSALAQGNLTSRDVKGGTLIFCAGCAGALGPRVDEGLAALRRLLPGVPVLGMCTFGEQGFVPGVGSLHQDLSLSLTLFA